MNDMHELDDHLRRALRPVEPRRGFADRVRARVAEDISQQKRPTIAAARWAIAATLALIVAGGVWYRADEQRRTHGEEAKRQVLLSLDIASHKLRAIEMKVNRREDR